jgi:hypothetical protein
MEPGRYARYTTSNDATPGRGGILLPSMSIEVWVDSNRMWALERLSGNDGPLRLWTSVRLKFHTDQLEWQRELVGWLVGPLSELALPSDRALRGVFISDDTTYDVDAENVLFYDLKAGESFPSAPRRLVIERSFVVPPEPPVALAGFRRYLHVYEAIRPEENFAAWREGDPLAIWETVPVGRPTGDAGGWRVWSGMSCAEGIERDLGIAADAEWFGMRVEVASPPIESLKPLGIVKPVVDGVIASFQRFSESQEEAARATAGKLSERLRGEPGCEAGQLFRQLTEPTGAIFQGAPFKIQEGLQLDPCDHRCVAVDLAVTEDPGALGTTLSGSLFGVSELGTGAGGPVREPDVVHEVEPAEEAPAARRSLNLPWREPGPLRSAHKPTLTEVISLRTMDDFLDAVGRNLPIVITDKPTSDTIHPHPAACSGVRPRHFQVKVLENACAQGGYFQAPTLKDAEARWPRAKVCTRCR